jgi:prolyl oligopeptidase
MSEYGDPTNPEDLQLLAKQSPLHNVGNVSTYPSVLVTTAENDDRVVPGHSLKFLAELQCESPGEIGSDIPAKAAPSSSAFLGRIYSDTGHERRF